MNEILFMNVRQTTFQLTFARFAASAFLLEHVTVVDNWTRRLRVAHHKVVLETKPIKKCCRINSLMKI